MAMAAVSDHQIVGNLRKALSQLEAERDNAVKRAYATYQSRIESLTHTIAVITGEENDGVYAITETIGAVGEEKLQAVLDYMRAQETGRARQATIAKDLGFNTGTISVALRHLEAQGEVHKDVKERGSRVWEVVTTPEVAAS